MGAPTLNFGPRALRDAFNALSRYVESITPIGPGVTDSATGKGRYIAAPTPSGGGGTTIIAPPPLPWQPYASTWKGTGTDPHASDRIMRFRLYGGKVVNRTPNNMSDEFVAFGDPTDTGIEPEDAVYTQIYLTTPVSEASLGVGPVVYDRPTLAVAEGEDLLTAIGASPDFGSDGSLPPYLTISLGIVAYWGGSLHFYPGLNSYIWVSIIGSISCETVTRSFMVEAMGINTNDSDD